MSFWGPVAGAVIGAAGSYFGNKGGNPDQHANDPVRPEDLYLGSAQGGVNDIMARAGNLAPWSYYPQSTVADMNPYMHGSLNNLYNNPSGNLYQSQMGSFGGQATQSMASQMKNPNQAFQYNQGTFDRSMSNLMPALQGSYDAATRDNNRNLNWSTLPGLDMGAAVAGQQGGTKLGQQSALATAMTGDRNADIGASMYQNAVNTANRDAMFAGQQNLGAQMDLYQLGSAGLNSAYNMNAGNLQNQYLAGTGRQGYDQSQLTDSVNRFNFNQQEPYNAMTREMDIYNSGKAGQYAPRQTSTGMNTWESLSNGAQFGAGIYGAGQDAGWWGSTSPAGPTSWSTPQQSSNELRPFDTSGYAGMYR